MIELPSKIKSRIENQKCWLDNIGLSESQVFMYENQVLKIGEDNDEAKNEYIIMEWLKDKLPVPKVLACETAEGKSYLLMTKIQGKMSCDEEYMSNPMLLTKLLSNALKLLWQTDITECPCIWDIDRKLEMAKYRIEHDMVDTENIEPDTYGENGFDSPKELFRWLVEHKPKEEPVLSHGDFCLPNIILEGNELKGYIDLGRMGVADRWQDIAICYRSLLHNYNGKYGGKTYEGYNPEMFFEKLGIEPDWEKIRYYILLDELF